MGGTWVVSAVGQAGGSCPGCGEQSTLRHGWHQRRLQDLPVQGVVVTVKLGVIRWRCGNAECERQTFADPLPEIASPHARRTCRVAEIVQLLGHGVGGLPGERLMKRLGMPVSDDTILRQLKRCATARGATTTVRIAGIDDWSWRKGCTYGTIVVDLERGEVVDVLSDRSAPGTAEWLSRILRSKSSAAIAAVCTRRARERARRRRGRLLTGSISCRTCARRSRPN